MTCAACSTRLEKVLNKQSGVVSAQVNLAANSAHIDYDGGQVSPLELTGAYATLASGGVRHRPWAE
jgi:Cu+-exporting ATPase